MPMTFSSFVVAKQVVEKEQNFKGKVVRVEFVETETHMNEETSEQPGTPEEKFGRVLVSGLPEGATENALHIHFQKKKNGGGEVKEVKLLPGKKAIVVFEDIEGSVFSIYPIKRLNIAVLGPSVRREYVFISSILDFFQWRRGLLTHHKFSRGET